MASSNQRKLIKLWRSKGYFVLNLIKTSTFGIPDIVALKPNHVVFIESKEKWDKLRPLQKIVIRKLIRLGFEVYLNKKKCHPEVKKTNLF
ncbi:MAG TPA: VRR-NUC domain-containing protein [Chitinophagaceae bacterium]|nr:VRR-NUC domain-containing protein [Chitinophagaceae bacterium]